MASGMNGGTRSGRQLTTSNGAPVDDNQNSLSAGPNGPLLLQDFHLIDKLAHFDRERIPERVVHAKGSGAHGYFEVTNPEIAKFTQAKFLATAGKRTPLFLRFSTVGGEKGSADTARDPRGFAIKFYTEDGNYDMVGNNTPVFFIRDPSKFPDFIHTQKRNPQTNMPDPNMFWDFLSLTPESCHQVSILFSDRGTPYGYRFMNGYSSHTFKWVNADGEYHWVKYHFKCDQGIKNFDADGAGTMASADPDFAQRDLFQAIAAGEHPSWSWYVQLMTPEQAKNYRFNPFDITKVWPHKDFPLVPVGRVVLNRNPENYFAEVEQVAFSPSYLVPGIEPSPDKMLQGRLFSYPDTHRHRLGPNYSQIPINCPYASRVQHHQRDGAMTVDGNKGSAPNYEPNSFGYATQASHVKTTTPYSLSAVNPASDALVIDRWDASKAHPNSDYVQAGDLFRLMCNERRTRLTNNIGGHLAGARKDIRDRQIAIFAKCDPLYGKMVSDAVDSALSHAKKVDDGMPVEQHRHKTARL